MVGMCGDGIKVGLFREVSCGPEGASEEAEVLADWLSVPVCEGSAVDAGVLPQAARPRIRHIVIRMAVSFFILSSFCRWFSFHLS